MASQLGPQLPWELLLRINEYCDSVTRYRVFLALCLYNEADETVEDMTFKEVLSMKSPRVMQVTLNASTAYGENRKFVALSLLDKAADGGNVEMINWMARNEWVGVKDVEACAYQIVRTGNIQSVRAFFDLFGRMHRFTLNEMLGGAAAGGWLEIMNLIRSKKRTWPPMQKVIGRALAFGHLDAALLAWSWSPTVDELTLKYDLYAAVYHGHIHIIQYFMLKHPNVLEPEMLHSALREGRLDIVITLFSYFKKRGQQITPDFTWTELLFSDGVLLHFEENLYEDAETKFQGFDTLAFLQGAFPQRRVVVDRNPIAWQARVGNLNGLKNLIALRQNDLRPGELQFALGQALEARQFQVARYLITVEKVNGASMEVCRPYILRSGDIDPEFLDLIRGGIFLAYSDWIYFAFSTSRIKAFKWLLQNMPEEAEDILDVVSIHLTQDMDTEMLLALAQCPSLTTVRKIHDAKGTSLRLRRIINKVRPLALTTKFS